MENMRRNRNRITQSVLKRKRRRRRQIVLFAACICTVGLVLMMGLWYSRCGKNGDILSSGNVSDAYVASIADNSSLQRLIDQSSQIDVDQYTNDSVKNMFAAVQEAKSVISMESTSKNIAQAYFNLANAMNNLKRSQSYIVSEQR